MVANAKIHILIILLSYLLCGCSINSGISTGSSTFRGFSLIASRPDSIDTAWRSSIRALDSLKISVSKRLHDDSKALILGVTRESNSVRITMRRLDANTTRIAIRVGVFGDQAFSREILRRIDNNLELLRYERNFNNNYY